MVVGRFSRSLRRTLVLLGMSAIALWGMLVIMQPTHVAFLFAERRIEPFLQGFYAPEVASDGTQYRWSNGAGTLQQIILPASHLVHWTVHIATAPVPLGIRMNQITVLHSSARHYEFLADTTQFWGENTLNLYTTRMTDSNEDRMLGVRVISVDLQQPPSNWPAVALFLTGYLLLFGLIWSARLLGVRSVHDAWVILAGLGLIALMHWLDPRAAAVWQRELATLLIALPPVLWLLLHRFPGVVVGAWAIALGVRLWGIRYPSFEGHDYRIHLHRLDQFRTGILSMVAHPYEYGKRQSIILPLYYWSADALSWLLGAPLAMHLIIVCAETSVALMVYGLLRRAAFSQRAATIAAVCVLCMPLSSSVLYWSFMQQITAHVLTFAIAMLASSQRKRDGWLAGLLLGIVALTHIGETLIAAFWYALVRIAQQDRFSKVWWLRWLPALVALAAVTPVYQTFLRGVGSDRGTLLQPVSADILSQMGVALRIAVAPVPVMAAVIVVALLLVQRPRLTLPWGLTALGFWLVELATQAQVRYLYTGAPLVAVALGNALYPLWRRGRAAQLLVVVVIGVVGWVSLALWIDAVMGWQKPRIDGLTH